MNDKEYQERTLKFDERRDIYHSQNKQCKHCKDEIYCTIFEECCNGYLEDCVERFEKEE